MKRQLVGPSGGVYRYRGDTYYGGGEWLLLTSSLAWHERVAGERETRRASCAGGCARRRTTNGDLPEQVTGASQVRGRGRAVARALGAGRDAAPLVARDVPDLRGGRSDGAPAGEGDLRAGRADRRRGAWHDGSVRLARTSTGSSPRRASRTGFVSFPPQPEGGYGVDADGASTALDVLADPLSRPRYGFVSRYEPGPGGGRCSRERAALPPERRAVLRLDVPAREADAAGRRVRGHARPARLARHRAPARRRGARRRLAADGVRGRLRGGRARRGRSGRRTGSSAATARRGCSATSSGTSTRRASAGSRTSRPTCVDALERSGSPASTSTSTARPKWRCAADGTRGRSRRGIPGADRPRRGRACRSRGTIFNNVNDFPTFATVRATQALTYIEVWAPHTTLAHLAEPDRRRGCSAPDRPVILAAYLSAYQGDEAAALQAEKLQLATVFSHGGTVLLHGEESAVLTEAYYVTHKEIAATTQDDGAAVLRPRRPLRRPALRRGGRHAHASRRRERRGADRGGGAGRDGRRRRDALGTRPARAGRAARQPDRPVGAERTTRGTRRRARRSAARRRSRSLDPRRGEDAPGFAIADPGPTGRSSRRSAGASEVALRRRHLAHVRPVGPRLDPGRRRMSRHRPPAADIRTSSSRISACPCGRAGESFEVRATTERDVEAVRARTALRI